MKPQVPVVAHWEHQGSHQSAEDGQSRQGKDLEAVWNNRKTDGERNAGQRSQGEEEPGKHRKEGKREGGQRPKGRVADRCTSAQTRKC